MVSFGAAEESLGGWPTVVLASAGLVSAIADHRQEQRQRRASGSAGSW